MFGVDCKKLVVGGLVALGSALSLPMVAQAQNPQNVNNGSLFINEGTTLYFQDGLLQNVLVPGLDAFINQGTLYIDFNAAAPDTSYLQFTSGVINQVNAATAGNVPPDGNLTVGWNGGPPPAPAANINYHTVFAPGAFTIGAEALADGGPYDSLVDGPVRREAGRSITLPLGDVDAGGTTHSGPLTISNAAGFSDVDAEYFWRNGITDLGGALGPTLTAISPLEYWQVWGNDALTLGAGFAPSSDLVTLLGAEPIETLTLAGWDGTQWINLVARLQDANGDGMLTAADLTGEGVVQTLSPVPNLRDYRVITFAVAGDEEPPVLGVAKDFVEDLTVFDPAVPNRAILTFDFVLQNYGSVTDITMLQLVDDLGAQFGTTDITIVSLGSVDDGTTVPLTVNAGYTGLAPNVQLLAGTDTLRPGERGRVRLVVAATFPSAQIEFTNAAVGSGITPGGIPVEDTSTDGNNPDTDGDGTPDEDTPTFVDVDYPTQFIQMTKRTLTQNVGVGEPVIFVITATNLQPFPVTVDLVDSLPPGFSYEPGSALIETLVTGVQPLEPTINGRNLVWSNITLAPGEEVRIQLIAIPGVGVREGSYTNLACAISGTDPNIICAPSNVSNVAQSTFEIQTSAVFDCSTVIGQVFFDDNLNGFQDDGETGVPGVRIGSPRGFFVNPDSNGRYNVPCAAIPDSERGSNFVLKLDESTIPIGYRLTTENPRSIRLTRGKLSELNFGIGRHCVVDISLDERAFISGGLQLHSQWQPYFDDVFQSLASSSRTDCNVRVRMHACDVSAAALNRQRVSTVRDFVDQLWSQKGGDGNAVSVELRTGTSHQCTTARTSDFILVPRSIINGLPPGSVELDPATLNAGTGPGRVEVPAGYRVYRTPAQNLVFVPDTRAPGYRIPDPQFGAFQVPNGSVQIQSNLPGYDVYLLPDGQMVAVPNGIR